MALSVAFLLNSGTITHLKLETFDKNGKVCMCQHSRCKGKKGFRAKPTVVFNAVLSWSSLPRVVCNGSYFVQVTVLAGDLLSHFWKKLHVPVWGVANGTRSFLDYACLLIFCA